jgi:hypothetical protein
MVIRMEEQAPKVATRGVVLSHRWVGGASEKDHARERKPKTPSFRQLHLEAFTSSSAGNLFNDS